MRNLSCFYTQKQIKDEIKDVTRRIGWKFLKVGDLLRPVVKCQGLKKGEKMQPLLDNKCLVVLSTRWEPLNEITPDDVIREGFPGLTTFEFIKMFMRMNDCSESEPVNRIEFGYVQNSILSGALYNC